MNDKTIVVTGAGSGIGLETADALAAQGAKLLLAELDRQRGEAAVTRIGKTGLKPMLFLGDLSLQSEIRRVAAEILAATPRIDVLINNAGAWFNERRLTAEGIERTFALNHLGYFLLTLLLLERMKASPPARVICVASDGHKEATLDFDDLQCEKDYSGRIAYCRSKLANVLFTRALSRRLDGTGVTVNCLHPGHILSNFFDNVSPGAPAEERNAQLERSGYVAAQAGARTPVYLASSAEVFGVSGRYFDDGRISEPAAAALDEVAAERLFAESLRLCGLAGQECV